MNNAKRIRQYLRDASQATSKAIAIDLGMTEKAADESLKRMPDTYIADWTNTPGAGGQWAKVWRIVEVPQDKPHPRNKKEHG